MRLAYVCADPGVPVFGRKGCSVHVQEVIRAMRRQGISVELFATRFDGDAPQGLESVPTHALPQAPKGDPGERERACVAANATLAEMLDRQGPFDAVYERYSLWSEAGMEYARSTKIRGLLEVNAPLVEEQKQRRSLVDESLAESSAVRIFEAASGLLAVSEEVAGYLVRTGVERDQILVTPNGVDGHRFANPGRPAQQRRPGEFTIGFVGTLKPWHGLDILFEAMQRLYRDDPKTRLLIVGDGPLRKSLQADLPSLGRGIVDAVKFVGATDHSEVPAWLAAMDVVVAPYPELPDFYFSPLKLFEYMAAGRPVVASRIGQVAEMIDDGVNGLLTPPGDAVSLARALRRIRDDRSLGERIGRAAQQTILDNHSWDIVVERLLDWGMALPSNRRPASVEGVS